MTTAVDLMQFH